MDPATRPVADGPGRVGDDSPRCYLCGRDTSDGDYLNFTQSSWATPVMNDVPFVRVCSVCWEKRDEDGIDIPLDMTRDEGGDE